MIRYICVLSFLLVTSPADIWSQTSVPTTTRTAHPVTTGPLNPTNDYPTSTTTESGDNSILQPSSTPMTSNTSINTTTSIISMAASVEGSDHDGSGSGGGISMISMDTDSIVTVVPSNASSQVIPSTFSISASTFISTPFPTSTGTPTMPEITTSEVTTKPGPVSTEENKPLVVGVAVASVILFILIVILCALICFFHMYKNVERKHKKIVEFALQEVNGDNDKFLAQDVLYGHIDGSKLVSLSAEQLMTYVPQLHRDNCFSADEEYESIKDMDPEFSKHAASQDCNETKNRYINILSRDETRVVLSSIPKVHGSDYINANYIDGYNHENEYIAAQGPLPNTTIDFWRMVWEQNVHNIVMVTNPVENGMVKCHEYWPSNGTQQYGMMVVTLIGEKLFPEFIQRTFTLTTTNKHKKMSQVCVVREITQFHFTDWPDFGVPENASSMLKFVRRVRTATSPTHGPVVVHCSAGVGRTGTFIAIDVMLQKMMAKEKLNIQEFVCRMRAERAFMIQTSAQYLFVYDALLHAHIHGCTEVRASLLGTHLTLLDKPASSGPETTILDQEFNHIMSMRFPSDHFFSVAMEECNTAKNRDTQNLPLDHNRVVLEDVDKAAGEDYINASFVDGFYNRTEFIATQHPVPTTRGDLWRMILERDINTLVVIGALEDDYDCYWPVEGMHEYDGGITVELKDTQEIEESKITKRTFHVSTEQGDSFVSVTQFHLHGWPKKGVPSSPQLMLDLVERSRKHWRETGFNLIAVHTATAVEGEVSGVYCGSCILLRQLEVEGCADLVTTAQKLRHKRPAIITNKEYYRFMYNILVSSL